VSVVEATQLGVSFRGKSALASVNLTAEPGEIIGLLGPYGCGKSTLLRVLASLLAPDSGTVRILGQTLPARSGPLRKRIGFVPDTPAHIPEISGWQNAGFFVRAAETQASDATARLAALFERLDIASLARTPAGAYSRGNAVKLALAETLLLPHELLLLDESDGPLDVNARMTLQEMLREHARAEACVLIASHDTRFLQNTCSRVILMHHGRIILDDTPAALLSDLNGTTHVDVELDNADVAIHRMSNIDIVAQGPGFVRISTRDGANALPGICTSLVAAGVAIRTLRVHEPDLGDVFARATGSRLENGQQP
jgi:ABC-type multidrug transport system ATPase subunit